MWIKYRISDRSGHGWDNWHFYETYNGSDTDDIKEAIIHGPESWAANCEYYEYRLEFEPIDITQLPDTILEKEIKISQASLDYHNKRIVDLSKILNERY